MNRRVGVTKGCIVCSHFSVAVEILAKWNEIVATYSIQLKLKLFLSTNRIIQVLKEKLTQHFSAYVHPHAKSLRRSLLE